MDQTKAQRALSLIAKQKASLVNLDSSDLATALPIWTDRTIRRLSTVIQPDELRLMSEISTETWEGDRLQLQKFLSELETSVQEEPELTLLGDPIQGLRVDNRPTQSGPGAQSGQPTNYVFVVHGHDSLAKIDVARTLEKIKLNPIVLHEQPNEGKTIIEKFERDASRVGFAVVILTPDDEGYPQGKPNEAKPRARQNVILELGYFSAALGRSRVCVLFKGDVELPSDYLGVIYVAMDEHGNWRFALAKELKQAGLTVDLNDLI